LGLGHGGRAELFATAHRPEVVALVGVAPELEDRRADQPAGAAHGRGDGRADFGHLLDADGVGNVVESGPAVLLGHDPAEEAELGGVLDDLGRVALLAVVLGDVRSDLTAGGGEGHAPGAPLPGGSAGGTSTDRP